VPFLPNNELVAVAWLQALDGIPAGKVATSLPKDVATFADGFLTVSIVGGSPQVYVPMRRPVVQVDTWVSSPGSSPRWGRANDLAELVRVATYDYADEARPMRVELPAQYDAARVHSAFLLTEPRRVEGDPARHARYTFDLQLHWSTV